jgi:TatA/E family protein of Tat protein translocase
MPLPSGFEWIVILVIALLILGPGKLPDVASAVGKSIREFRKASSDVQEAVKIDTSPLPAGPAQPAAPPAPGTQPAQTQPTPQSTSEPAVAQPVAPIAPTAGTVSPVVTTTGEPAPVADASPTDVAPKAND